MIVFMNFADLVAKNRSYRRFDQQWEISPETLRELVGLARLTPSGRNMQSLRFFLSREPLLNEMIFSCLGWAGYLKDWPGPEPGERPSAYIVLVHDTSFPGGYFCDDGIVLQTLLLGAVERGLGGCILGSVKKDALRAILSLSERYEILYVLALGKPVEEVRIEPMEGGDIRYWRDGQGVHHVPKRDVDELIIS